MGGNRATRRKNGRWTLWTAAVGLIAIAVAILAPGVQEAGASAGATTEREHRTSFHAVGQVRPTTPPLTPRLDVRLVVAPVAGGELAVSDAPRAPAPSQVLPAVNELGSPLVLLAVHTDGDWYEVLLPSRPNGSSAWVPASSVTATVPTVRVDVSLAAHTLQVVRIADGAVLLTSAIGAGAPSRPTPTGLFFVRDFFPTQGANHPYGPMAFGLSGHSDVLTSFGTGDGRIAIHGTNAPSTIGADASNGCVHVPNDVDRALIPILTLGTPVTISA
jgi:lipoprotein-anchoring transpeptidase ErfK/SrfK